MSQISSQPWRRVTPFTLLITLSMTAHFLVLLSLKGAKQDAVKRAPVRVKARLIKPPPKPKTPPKAIAELKKVEPKKVEPKKVEPKKVEVKKVEPQPKKKAIAKKRKRRKKRKKRRAARTLVAKGPGASVSLPTSTPEPEKMGKVTDLGDWDPDATDDEVARPYDPDAEPDTPEKVVPEPVEETKPKKKDRKATCKKCVKPTFPPSATAVLPTRVVLSIKVKSNGKVASVTVIRSSDPLLAQAAKRAMMSSTFYPAYKNGVPVADRIPFTVEFK